jgi:hypothetical protein
MLAMLVTAAGMIVGPNAALFESALDACKRLAAAAAVDPAGSTAQERADRRAGKAELDALIAYVEKIHALKAAGEWNSATMEVQYLTVLRDLINTGTDLAVLPEEVLGWQRIGLVLSFNLYCQAWSRVPAVDEIRPGDLRQDLAQAQRAFGQFRNGYQAALAKYAPPPR